MRRVCLLFLSILMFAAAFQSCAVTKNIDYEIADLEDLSEETVDYIDMIKQYKGYNILFETEDFYYVYIGSGEKMTGGYGISIVSAQFADGRTKVTVSETSPGKDDIVTEVLTYPYVVVKVSRDLFVDAVICGTDGSVFEQIAADRLRRFDIIGYITSVEKNDDHLTILVEGEKNGRSAYDKARIKVDSLTVITISGEKGDMDSLTIGLRVGVLFEGPVAESYPVQAYAKEVIEGIYEDD
jgi:hypothetical protein